jgi:hypothetical protein
MELQQKLLDLEKLSELQAEEVAFLKKENAKRANEVRPSL